MAQHHFRILLVDDNPADLELMQTALEHGTDTLEIFTTSDGEMARDLVTCWQDDDMHFDLILLDLDMPKMDGFSFMEWLQNAQTGFNKVVIVVSNSKDPEDITRAYQKGANAFIRKPGNYNELTELMQSVKDFWLHKAVLPQ